MKALIVEDNESLRMMFQTCFEEMGFITDGAENGSVAFKKIQEADYDIIMSDMDMPVVNGMEFYQLVLSYRPDMIDRIVFSTGNGCNGEYRKFFEKISCPVLYKPFPLCDLEKAVNRLSRQRFNNKSLGTDPGAIMPIYA